MSDFPYIRFKTEDAAKAALAEMLAYDDEADDILAECLEQHAPAALIEAPQ